jgi:hypothetical protein
VPRERAAVAAAQEAPELVATRARAVVEAGRAGREAPERTAVAVVAAARAEVPGRVPAVAPAVAPGPLAVVEEAALARVGAPEQLAVAGVAVARAGALAQGAVAVVAGVRAETLAPPGVGMALVEVAPPEALAELVARPTAVSSRASLMADNVRRDLGALAAGPAWESAAATRSAPQIPTAPRPIRCAAARPRIRHRGSASTRASAPAVDRPPRVPERQRGFGWVR